MPTTVPLPELRANIRPMRSKSLPLAVTIFTCDLVLYAAFTWLAMTAASALATLLFGALEGVSIAMLFVVGHDACHGSFTSSRRLNAWIGRVSFLPSLTPFAAWDIGHNQNHHAYTNLKGRDYVWAPFSKNEFDALPAWRQFLERCYRTPPGVGLYYGVEIWWRRLFFAPSEDLRRGRVVLADSILSLFYGVVLSAAAVAAGAQSRCTVHAVMPRLLDLVVHNIMQHTAHHLDVTIPLYHLGQAQASVEAADRSVAIVEPWSLGRFFRHLRICKVYNYEHRCWLGFDGKRR